MVTLTFDELLILPRNCIFEEKSNLLPLIGKLGSFFKSHTHIHTHGRLRELCRLRHRACSYHESAVTLYLLKN